MMRTAGGYEYKQEGKDKDMNVHVNQYDCEDEDDRGNGDKVGYIDEYTTKMTELGNGSEFRCLCPTHFRN